MSKKIKKQIEPNEGVEKEKDEMAEEASKESEPTKEVKEKKKYLTKENLVKAGKYVLAATLGAFAGYGVSKLFGDKDESYDDYDDESSYDKSYTNYDEQSVDEDTEE